MWASVDNSDESSTPLATLRSWLKVSEAAKYLGVTSKTLRNWDESGKLKARRHPINGYRLYRRDDLDKFLAQFEGLQTKRPSVSKPADRTKSDSAADSASRGVATEGGSDE